MDIDEAWERFQKAEAPFASFRKASLDDKLDTIAAQLQEISTDMERVSNIVPKIMGDETALKTDEEDPLDMVLGGDSPDDVLAGMGSEPTSVPPAPEGAGEGAAPAGSMGEEPMEKAEDDPEEAKKELSEQEPAPPAEPPQEEPSAPAPEPEPEPEQVMDEPIESEEVAVEVTPTESDGDIPVEVDEGAGQEGISPEGASTITDEVNENQPEGLLNIYDRFIEGLKLAAHAGVENGRLAEVSNLAGAQNAIDAIWRAQVAPSMDSIMGGDTFRRSCDSVAKSGDKMTGEKMSDGIESSHEVHPSKTSAEGEENTTGHDNSATEAPALEGRVAGTDAPHALNNDTTTVKKSEDSFEKDCGPAPDGQGMEPSSVEKSMHDFEGYDQPYEDESGDDRYVDPIKKSVPSFREIMAEPKEERFIKGAIIRRGPHLTMDEFYKAWNEEEKSMSSEEPVEGSVPFEKEGDDESGIDDVAVSVDAQDIQKSEGAMTSGTEGAVNPTFSDDAIEKSTAGQPGPVMSTEEAMQKSDSFEKGTAGTKSVDDTMSGPASTEHACTGVDEVEEAMTKSADESRLNGKHIPSMQEMMSFRKSMPYDVQKSSAIGTAGGDVRRPNPDMSNFAKSTEPRPVVRMGRGIDPHKVTELDWEEYRLYKESRQFGGR